MLKLDFLFFLYKYISLFSIVEGKPIQGCETKIGSTMECTLYSKKMALP